MNKSKRPSNSSVTAFAARNSFCAAVPSTVSPPAARKRPSSADPKLYSFVIGEHPWESSTRIAFRFFTAALARGRIAAASTEVKTATSLRRDRWGEASILSENARQRPASIHSSQGWRIKIAVILSGAPRGRRWRGAESKDPVSSRKIVKQDRMPFRHSTGLPRLRPRLSRFARFFTAHRPATFARADASFRMTSSILMRQPCHSSSRDQP